MKTQEQQIAELKASQPNLEETTADPVELSKEEKDRRTQIVEIMEAARRKACGYTEETPEN